jgi:hypothetical protein
MKIDILTTSLAAVLLSRAAEIRGGSSDEGGDWAALESAIFEAFPHVELAEECLVKGKTLEKAMENLRKKYSEGEK